jgi:hypothetical protein
MLYYQFIFEYAGNMRFGGLVQIVYGTLALLLDPIANFTNINACTVFGEKILALDLFRETKRKET